jgi:hypothetical protein
MHDRELQCRAQYNQYNDAPDDLYIVLMAQDAGAGNMNNFPTFSRHLRMMRYPKDFKTTIEKYDDRSDPSIGLKMYIVTAQEVGGNEDH